MFQIHSKGGSSMSANSTATRPAPTTEEGSASARRQVRMRRAARQDPPANQRALPQLSLRGIIGVWAAAALPMGLLAWVVAPALADQLSGPGSLSKALIICLTAGLIWQVVLVMGLVRREQGTLRYSVLRDALWLRAPRSPKTGRRGGKAWLIT